MIAFLARISGVSTIAIEGALLALFLLAFVGAGFKVYSAGYDAADAEWQAKALQTRIDAMEKDRDDARAAAADAKLRLAALDQEAQADKERTANYAAELASRPAPGCALTDDDLRGMLVQSQAKPGATRKRAPAISRWLDGARSRAAAPPR